jgi:hypothetical protein
MQKAIACSAISGDGMAFGNTGIRAPFDDLNELGNARAGGHMPDALLGDEVHIAKVAVQFATQMARQKVDCTAHEGGATIGPEDGIVVWPDEGGAKVSPGDANVMEIDLTETLWRLTAPDGEAAPPGVNVEGLWDLLTARFKITQDAVEAIMEELYGSSTIDTVTKWAWSAKDEGLDLVPPLRVVDPTAFNPFEQRFFAGANQDDRLIGQWEGDIIDSAGTDDIIFAGRGNDLVAAQSGCDWIADQISLPDESGRNATDDDAYFGDGGPLRLPTGDLDADFIIDTLLRNLINQLSDVANNDNADRVKYTLQTDPNNGSALLSDGLLVQDLYVENIVGYEFVRAIIGALGRSSSDLLLGIEEIHLSERKDIIIVTPQMRDPPIWIDMADPGGLTFSKSDWDEVSYANLGGGIANLNGSTGSLLPPNPPLVGGLSSLAMIVSLLFEAPPNAEVVLRQ